MATKSFLAVGLAAVFLASTAFAAVSREHFAQATTRAIEHHSMHPPHLDSTLFHNDVAFWEFSGSTVVTDNYVRLTPDRNSQVGMIWNTEPLDLPAFEITMGFRVHSKAGYGADGMALWIVDEVPEKPGPLFGHPMHFVGIGILFDSYDNDRYRDNPAIHVLYNAHGSSKREYNPQQDFRGQQAGNCFHDYRNTNKNTLSTVRLRYKDGTAEVFVSKNGGKDEVLCARVFNVQLNPSDTLFLGVTAETGGISDMHDVHFIHTYPLDDVNYDHDVYQHEPFSHANEQQNKQYWKAKTPEELALEEEEKRHQAELLREQSDRLRRQAEEANKMEADRRQKEADQKEEADRKAKEEEAAAHKKAQEEAAHKKAQEEAAHKKAEEEAAAHRDAQKEEQESESVSEGEGYDGDDSDSGVDNGDSDAGSPSVVEVVTDPVPEVVPEPVPVPVPEPVPANAQQPRKFNNRHRRGREGRKERSPRAASRDV